MHSDGEQQTPLKYYGKSLATGDYHWFEMAEIPSIHSHLIEEVEKDFTKLWVEHIESGAIEPTSLVLVNNIFSLLKRKGV